MYFKKYDGERVYDFFAKLVGYRCHIFHTAQKHPSAFHKKQNNNITVPEWVCFSGCMTGRDRNFNAQLQKKKLSGIDKVLARLFFILQEVPLHLSNSFSFFKKAWQTRLTNLACCHESPCQEAARSSCAIKSRQWRAKYDAASGRKRGCVRKCWVPQYLSEMTRDGLVIAVNLGWESRSPNKWQSRTDHAMESSQQDQGLDQQCP